MTALANFKAEVLDFVAPRVAVDERGCWLWQKGRNKHGYAQGRFTHIGTPARAVHRVVWEAHNGPVPDGLHLDHLCRVRHCVNPSHLDAVSPRENILRGVGLAAVNATKTHCKSGHELTPENTSVSVRTGRRGGIERNCKTCQSQWKRAYVARRASRAA